MKNDAKELRDLLEEILSRIPDDNQTGIMLSGGLDSSIVACILLNDKRKLRSISASFKGYPLYDETKYVESIKNKYPNLEVNYISPLDIDLLKELKNLIEIIQRPINSGSFLLQYLIIKKAKELGIKNLIYCQWPDELLGGYNYFLLDRAHDDFLNFKFKDALINIKEYIRRSKSINTDWILAKVIWAILFSKGLRHSLNKSIIKLQSLIDIAQKTAQSLGVNLILPYGEPKIVEFSQKLNLDRLVYRGETKIILREVGFDILPDEILKRKEKFSFFAPDGVWLLKNKDSIQSLDNQEVKRLYNKFLKNPYKRWYRKLWIALSKTVYPV